MAGSAEPASAEHTPPHDPTARAEGDVFSRGVRLARDRLAPASAVTAGALAAEIQREHGDYVGGRFAQVRLRVHSGPTASVADWLERVRGLYADTQTDVIDVIDGQLVVLGLAELDEVLEDALSAGGLLSAWRATARALPRNTKADRTKWTSDTPASDDLLGRRFLAEALATRLRSMAEDDSNSFLVHIDGAWGSGKSSLFTFLETELRGDFLIVKVNAWREQQVGVQWWTLHNALRQAIETDAAHGMAARARSHVDVIRTRLVPFVATVAALIAVLVFLFVFNFDVTLGGEVANSIGKILGLLTLGWAGVTAAYGFIVPESRRSAEAFVAKSANPMWEVQQLFARTLLRTDKSVVFLIDDLDRCEEQYIIDFLEVMQTLVRDTPERPRGRPSTKKRPAGPYAFVAADGQWIRSSYESHFGKVKITDVPGRPLGYLFLEKIFQLQVRLPSITEESKRAFFDALLTGAAQPASAEQRTLARKITEQVNNATTAPEISQAAEEASTLTDSDTRMKVLGAAAVKFSDPTLQTGTRHELGRYWKLLEPNPRSIKLFVHTYGTLQSLRTLEGIPLQTTPLALWTIVEIRWPMLADHLRAHPDDIDPNHRGTPEPIAALLATPDVSAVVASPDWGPLTPSQVRECTGIRVGASADTD
nr:P-loop NTPase fold protein [Cryobacterium roopkundense]